MGREEQVNAALFPGTEKGARAGAQVGFLQVKARQDVGRKCIAIAACLFDGRREESGR